MLFGISLFVTRDTLRPDELAVAAEEREFESLWLPEHSHIPISRNTPWGGVPGAAPLPPKYWKTFETFVSLGAAAAVTSRIKLASGITLLAQRDPIWTAKEVATIDQLSNGRMIFGVGYGWNREEMASHGVRYQERRQIVAEKLEMIRSIWTEEVASFQGITQSLEPSWAEPKPVQKPHPPIHLGAGAGPRTIADLVKFCDGWIPLGRHDLAGTIHQVREAIEQAGRDPSSLQVSYWTTQPDADRVAELKRLGVDRIVIALETDPPAEIIKNLDRFALLAAGTR